MAKRGQRLENETGSIKQDETFSKVGPRSYHLILQRAQSINEGPINHEKCIRLQI